MKACFKLGESHGGVNQQPTSSQPEFSSPELTPVFTAISSNGEQFLDRPNGLLNGERDEAIDPKAKQHTVKGRKYPTSDWACRRQPMDFAADVVRTALSCRVITKGKTHPPFGYLTFFHGMPGLPLVAFMLGIT